MTSPQNQRWLVLVPPRGAARSVGLALVGAFQEEVGRDLLVLDCKTYVDGYRSLLRNPEEEIIVDLFGQSMLTKALEFKATHVLVLALCPVTQYFLSLLRNQRIRTLHWFFEDYRSAPYWQDVVKGYDIFMAVQRGPVENFCNENGITFRFLPNATMYQNQLAPIAWSLRRYDVGFIGLPSAYRVDILERLAAAGLKVAIGGEGWDAIKGILRERVVYGGWVGPQQASDLYRNCRMVVNLSQEDPSTMREEQQVSPRACDAVFCGAVLLTENLPLNEISLQGVERVEFNTPTELLVRALALREEGPAQSKLEANQQVIRNLHLLQHRVRSIMQYAETLEH